MRKVVFLLMMAGIFTEAIGQDLYASAGYPQSPVFTSSGIDSNFDNVVLPPGYRMKRVGSTLTVAGAALFLGGVIMISDADKNTYYNSSTGLYESDPKLTLGVLMVTGGVGMMVPGIIFWSKGAKRYNRYLENLQGTINTNGAGVTINFKF